MGQLRLSTQTMEINKERKMSLRDLWTSLNISFYSWISQKKSRETKEQKKVLEKPKNIDLYIQEVHEFTAG